ncbi:MAG: glycosyltransferase family 2 protein [Bacteroidales bacterium]|nr:glycosyltransferase family 2 protein [Bacteroidales bacterium]
MSLIINFNKTLMSEIDISVGIICYNQANFVHKAIQSVLGQKTKYKLELIVCDDASTDNSIEVINDTLKNVKSPNKVLQNPQNMGPLATGTLFLKNANGKYICWIDADDYWIFDKKIETQVDFLENNKDYSACFHDSKIISTITDKELSDKALFQKTHGKWKSYSQFNTYNEELFPWELINRKIIPTASLMVRNGDYLKILEKYKNLSLSISWALQLEFIKNSKFKYFNHAWSVYLDHKDGFSKKFDLVSFKLNNIKILELLLKDEYYQHFKKDIFRSISSEYFHLLHSHEAQVLSKKEYHNFLKKYRFWNKKAIAMEIESFKENFKQKKL